MSSTRIADVLKNALPPACRQRVFSLELLQWKWSALVGRELALRSKPYRIDGDVLTVAVNDAAWGRMLLKLQRRILPRLASVIGAARIRRIQFIRREKPLWEADEPPGVRKPAPRQDLSGEVPSPVLEAARHIKDPGLRNLVTRTACRYLAARAKRADSPGSGSRRR